MLLQDTGLISRRFLLAESLGAVALLASATDGATKKEKKEKVEDKVKDKKAAKKISIGVQLYSVREDCKRDLPGTIAAIAKMGYMGVEFAGYYERKAAELRKMLDDNGLVCCGTHTAMDTLLGDNLSATIEFNKTLGNKFLVVPWLPENYRASRQAWLDTAKLFNELAEKVKSQGMRIGYHNHDVEFKPIDGELPWDTFCSSTSKDVIMQLDTGNALNGGADPLPFLYRYPERAVTVHLKEFSKKNDKALIGEGDINWKAFFALCKAVGGTEWYIVEQESYAYSPIDCIDRCLKNLRKMKLV